MKSAVVLSCDDNFIAYASVVARRIAMLSSENFPILVVSDGVSDDNKRLAHKYCPRISFVEIGKHLDGLPVTAGGHVRRATYGKLKLDEVVDADRILYVDGDISVVADVAPLLNLPLKAPIAAAFDGIVFSSEVPRRASLGMSEGAPYFNSGVMVFDAKAVRQEGIFGAAIKYALENPERLKYAEQDAINAVVDGRWQLLDWRWNATHRQYQSKPPFIRHFIGPAKPWSDIRTANIERVYIDQWRTDLLESPWPHMFRGPAGRLSVLSARRSDWSRPRSIVAPPAFEAKKLERFFGAGQFRRISKGQQPPWLWRRDFPNGQSPDDYRGTPGR